MPISLLGLVIYHKIQPSKYRLIFLKAGGASRLLLAQSAPQRRRGGGLGGSTSGAGRSIRTSRAPGGSGIPGVGTISSTSTSKRKGIRHLRVRVSLISIHKEFGNELLPSFITHFLYPFPVRLYLKQRI